MWPCTVKGSGKGGGKGGKGGKNATNGGNIEVITCNTLFSCQIVRVVLLRHGAMNSLHETYEKTEEHHEFRGPKSHSFSLWEAYLQASDIARTLAPFSLIRTTLTRIRPLVS